MNYRFHPAAEAELDQAIDFYETCQPGLGIEFANEVKVAIARIMEHPEAWAALSRHTRRCLLHRFPYGVIYHIGPDVIVIIAIANLHRLPAYWQHRITPPAR